MKTTFLHAPIDFRQVSARIEIGILRLAIDLLSDSTLLQKLVSSASRMTWQAVNFFRSPDAPRAARWAAAGLSIGFFTALLSALLSH
jgi:hypothetical protein